MFMYLILIWMFSDTEAAGLVNFKRSSRRTLNEACCKSTNLLTCQNVDVDSSALVNGEDLTMPGGVNVSFSNSIDPNGYFYTNNDGDEVLITFNHENGHMFGSMKTSSGKSYAIEKCEGSHVWQQFDMQSFLDGEPDASTSSPSAVQSSAFRSIQIHRSLDVTSMSTYSVMIYYTPEFEAITSDIGGFVDQVLAETNQGYANSKVPITIKKHCMERATISDMQESSDLLEAFSKMKPTKADIRNTADSAVLLAAHFNGCGRAYYDLGHIFGLSTVFTGNTLSITQKSCALGYFSFGHELGHNFGLYHDKATNTNPRYAHGHGHLIEKGSSSTGYRTILAYSASGHRGRVNYYSNPSVNYPATGTPTGVQGISNNAAVLVANRFIMAGIGDESSVCNSPCSIYTQPLYHFSGWKTKCSFDSNLVFDPRFYLATNNDLRCAFIKPGINTFDVAAQHWCDYGVKEGRQGIANFSSKAYLGRYGDLQKAFGNNSYVQATTHFINTGFTEGRNGHPTTVLKTQVSSCIIYKAPLYHFSGWKPKCDSDSPHIFDPRFYLATNNDLRCAFIKPGIKTFDVAAQHWCDYGLKEGRQGIADFDTRKHENSCILHKAPLYHFAEWTPKCSYDSNLVFDPRFYLATYNDLRCAFIKPGIDSFAAASQHWCDYGVNEGRHGIQSFNNKAYLARYKDLQKELGKDNIAQATTHFIETGFNEGRSGNTDVALTTKVSPCSIYTQPIFHFSSWKPKCFQDSNLVFDPRFYLATYNDLRCAFIKPGINTFDVAAQHWCDYGVKEGRQGIASFSSKAYLARYGDLQKAFGNNSFVQATTHFIQNRFKENRIGN